MRVLHKKKSYEGLLICGSFDRVFFSYFLFSESKSCF